MKTYNITYTKGHLVDTTTGKRIFLKRGGSFTLLGDDDQFEVKDELSLSFTPLNEKDKKDKLMQSHKTFNLKKIAQSGDVFLYRIGLSKRTTEDKERSFLLKATLLEDLYIKSNHKKWTLCNCYCETTYCLDGDLQMFEPVYGNSLSNMFSNMVTFYFPLQRSGACNAFTTFYLITDTNSNHYTLKNYKAQLINLDELRKKIINKKGTIIENEQALSKNFKQPENQDIIDLLHSFFEKLIIKMTGHNSKRYLSTILYDLAEPEKIPKNNVFVSLSYNDVNIHISYCNDKTEIIQYLREWWDGGSETVQYFGYINDESYYESSSSIYEFEALLQTVLSNAKVSEIDISNEE